jgi:hypothetical protein
MTDWKWRIFLFVRQADNTPENRQAFASIYVDNGSLETLENELKLFDRVVKFSASGELPATAFGANVPAQGAMRDAFKTFLDSLTNAQYVVVANTALPQYEDGELIQTTFNVTPSGQQFTWEDTLQYISTNFGQQVIEV